MNRARYPRKNQREELNQQNRIAGKRMGISKHADYLLDRTYGVQAYCVHEAHNNLADRLASQSTSEGQQRHRNETS